MSWPRPPPSVRIDDLGTDDIALEVTFWADLQRSDFKNTASAVRAAIVIAFLNAGIGLPDPDLRKLSLEDRRGGAESSGPGMKPRGS